MLESEIKKLTAAVEANTAALTGAAPAKTATEAAAAPAKTATEVAAAVGSAAGAAPAAAIPAAAAPPAAAAVAAAAAAAPVASEPAGQPVVEVDKKALTQKFIELAQAKGREVAQQLLAEYGVAMLPELDKTKWASLFAACDVKLAAK